MIFKLKKPVTAGDRTITELTIREEVVAGDLRGLRIGKELQFDDLLVIAGRLCGQTADVMHKISGKDAMALVALIPSFLEDGSTATSSTTP